MGKAEKGTDGARKTNVRRLAVLALLLAAAVICGYVDAVVPIPIPVPGVKIGVANVAITFVLYAYGAKEAALVSFLRVGIISLLFGNLTAAFYGLFGAAASLLIMCALKRTGIFGVIGVSAAGGAAHNAAQVTLAGIVLRGFPVRWYLPAMLLVGLAAGVLTGIADAVLLPRLLPLTIEGGNRPGSG